MDIISEKTLIILVWLFSSSVLADDISDFEIEGISIGDSLLNYMSKEEIQKGINDTKDMYLEFSKKFAEVYLYGDFKNYEYLSFLVKPNDLKYTIYSIRGIIPYKNEIEKCLLKLKEISAELSPLFVQAEKDEGRYRDKYDTFGKTYITYESFSLKNGGEIAIQCYDYSKKISEMKNWRDNLSISIDTVEAFNWFLTPIN